ncbi:MAG TPA: colicin E5-related ribonuclease [Acidobacteriaceae bacterium]|nr:colicin E5-related ribonuclease [Acidobacteriaceae bacterium]
MSPDYSGDDPDPIPYAEYDDPQSLNLYSYVQGNPLANTDLDGHGCEFYIANYTWNDGWHFAGMQGYLCDWGQKLADAGQKVINYLAAPRTPGCVGKFTDAGAGSAALAGAGLGLAGGPAAEITVPTGATEGFLIGGTGGFLAGMNACMTGGGGGGSGGSGGGRGKPKITDKIRRQMAKRGWTEQSVDQTISNPIHTSPSQNMATMNSATAYFNSDGSYVVVDDGTDEVVQVSNRNDPGSWEPDQRIVNPYRP